MGVYKPHQDEADEPRVKLNRVFSVVEMCARFATNAPSRENLPRKVGFAADEQTSADLSCMFLPPLGAVSYVFMEQEAFHDTI